MAEKGEMEKPIYDYTNTEYAKQRKEYLNKETDMNLFNVYIALLVLVLFIITIIRYPPTNLFFGALFIIIIFLSSVVVYTLWDVGVREESILNNFDLKVYPDFVEIPDWNKNYHNNPMKFPNEYIEKIYWNPNLDYFIIISTNEGLKEFNLKQKFKHIKKDIIDNESLFLNILKNNHFNVIFEEITLGKCIMKYNIFKKY